MIQEQTTRNIINFLKNNDLYISDNGINQEVISVSNINATTKQTLAWTSKNKIVVEKLNCDILIVPEEFTENSNQISIIKVTNPRIAFALIGNYFFIDQKEDYKISDFAVIDKNIILNDTVSIGHNSILEGDIRIGNNVKIKNNVSIIGKVTIGNNVVIKSGSVIGDDGFGYFKENATSSWEKFPHFSGVTIGNNVDIGSSTCIDRGVLSDTIIEDNVKIDNLCHIAHNAIIGNGSAIVANTTICGSVKIGKNVWVGPNSVIRDKLQVEDNALIGIGSVVTKNVLANTTVFGVPAKIHKK